MSLNQTPAAERIHIGIFGRRNAGKSSLINAMTGQDLAIVSEVKGTTTDPVQKAMELLPLGPVVLIDTPGLDDEGTLGKQRVRKTYQMLNKTDIALLVIDGIIGMTAEDSAILQKIREKEIPYLIVYNKMDLGNCAFAEGQDVICVSAQSGANVKELRERIGELCPKKQSERRLVGDLLKPLDFVLLVVPIDEAAPKGRLILPQQQTIRDVLESGATAIVVKDTELSEALERLQTKPDLVITDSQVFGEVDRVVPKEVPMTSFSILFARHKGNLKTVVEGAVALERLQDGDTILISEGCPHHRQCNDIGSVKLPRMVSAYTGKELQFAFTSGTEFPEDMSPYKLIIHCGGCMLNAREMQYRLRCAKEQGVPITNYGIAIAQMKGILKRSVEPFGGDL